MYKRIVAQNHQRKEVPCDGCTLCCRSDAVRLEQEDVVNDYKTEPHPYIQGAFMLAHKPNGECIYLEGSRCSIHDRAPLLCRAADCRSIALKYDFETARKLHNIRNLDIRVWDRGRKLIEEMQQKK